MCSVLMIFYIFVVTLINSNCTVPFLPAYAVCMRTNFKEALIDWHNGKLLIIIPFTIIVATNILFDYDDIQIVTPPRLYDINIIDHRVRLKYELNENTNTNEHSSITTMFAFQPLILRRVKWSSYFRLSEIRTQ